MSATASAMAVAIESGLAALDVDARSTRHSLAPTFLKATPGQVIAEEIPDPAGGAVARCFLRTAPRQLPGMLIHNAIHALTQLSECPENTVSCANATSPENLLDEEVCCLASEASSDLQPLRRLIPTPGSLACCFLESEVTQPPGVKDIQEIVNALIIMLGRLEDAPGDASRDTGDPPEARVFSAKQQETFRARREYNGDRELAPGQAEAWQEEALSSDDN